jgi:hypothetical protein
VVVTRFVVDLTSSAQSETQPADPESSGTAANIAQSIKEDADEEGVPQSVTLEDHVQPHTHPLEW